jgi:glycosyltransferase involved in cell wall biosynthesis
MKTIRLAVVTPAGLTEDIGGAERHYRGMVSALNFDNVVTERIPVLSDESSFETILESYLRFHELDLSGYDGVISTKGPSYMVRHRNHICWLLHTIRVFYDMFQEEFISPSPELLEQRDFILGADTRALSFPHTKKVFTNGQEVRERLRKFNRLNATVLHPPLERNCFQFQQCGRSYAFIVSRLHRWKRVDLAIRAMRHVTAPMDLLIAGTGEDQPYFQSLAGSDSRIRFLGYVDDKEIIKLYSNACAVPFLPLREDFGYITLEAFQSGKPVITCTDSGEPARIVRHGISGFVVQPDPVEIGHAMQFCYDHPERATEMGALGAASIRHIRWEAVRTQLLAALGF